MIIRVVITAGVGIHIYGGGPEGKGQGSSDGPVKLLEVRPPE